jgi:hypothetical protein
MNMNIERLTTIAEWLEAGAPERDGVKHFDMSQGMMFVESVSQQERADITSEKIMACGTVCCIAGTACAFFNDPKSLIDKALLNLDWSWLVEGVSWMRVHSHARELLGLSDEMAQELFMPRVGQLHEYTADHAARCIRRLIGTGEVDWEGTREVTP